MSLFSLFGIGEKKILAENTSVTGTVTEVKTCWWLKVNTKPVRVGALDGARFPHIIHFTYEVDGTEYRGGRYVNWAARCPPVGGTVRVYFRRADPAGYALRL